MSTQDIAYLSLADAAEHIRSRQLSPVELLDAVLRRTSALEPQLNVYITPMFDQAQDAARQAEQEIMAGQYRGPLHGIPVALKDNYWTQGVRTTAGSKILAEFVPGEDATVVAKLRAAGAVITGKTNMHEWALGGTTTNPFFGATHNPWRLDRVPGGSSGGSAAAVAAGLCYAATGSDTAGSIREPAAYCGVVGLKGTYGRTSIYGIIPLAWSLDHAGALTRTVTDTALVMNTIAGYDPKDLGSAPMPVPDFASSLGMGLQGLRLGVPRGFFYDLLDAEVRQAVETALGVLRDLGATLQEVDFSDAAMGVPIYTAIRAPEAAAFQEEFIAAHPGDYGEDVRPLVQLGGVILAKDYLRGQRLRTALRDKLATLLTQVDALVTPTTPTVAHPIGQPYTEIGGRPVPSPLALWVGFTIPFDLTGTPAISVPCGFNSEGLPIGLQIAGRAWDELTVLRIAAAYEQATPWHQRHPSL
jgi:aspartyl-tRNA(Asn)/glutamyl-tRNA(Gln) amidotransferase subunit A